MGHDEVRFVKIFKSTRRYLLSGSEGLIKYLFFF